MRLENPYAAWCLDEAIGELTLRLRRGDKRAIKPTSDNSELLKKLIGR